MSKIDIVDQLAALENIIDRNDGFVAEEAGRIRQELNVPSAGSLREHLDTLEEEQRLLSIGIIGRVKAGKSSLLNSVLFEGQDILPKAATPMTASLVIITHGEDFAATVEYFTPEDIEQTEKAHRIYAEEFDRELQQRTKLLKDSAKSGILQESIKEKARKQTAREFKEHRYSAAYDQYERMRNSGNLNEMKRRSAPEERVTANSLDDLKGKLGQYVGADGALMPFTKSVRLELPRDSLRNIQVVDTPGVNDPVVSREQRTQEYLKQCDVVLIVSPSGQFMSREDTNLMDRVTAREGVREQYLVAAQADTQLHGDLLEKSGNDLRQAMDMLRSQLGEQAVTTLCALKSGNPEIGNAFDQLIEGGEKRVMVTSSICNAMLLRFDQREAWDEGMNHAWELFKSNYSEYFDSDAGAREALKLLANIDTVQDAIAAARQSKDAIITQKRIDYRAGQAGTVQDFRDRLVKGIQARVAIVQSTDLAEVLEQKKAATKLLEDGGEAVDEAFDDSLETFKTGLQETIKSKGNRLIAETKSESQDALETRTETHSGRRKKSGFFNGLARIFGGGYENYSYTEEVTTLRTNAVKGKINDLVNDLQEEVTGAVAEAKREWKTQVQRQVTGALQDAVDDAGQFYAMLKKALRSSVNNMPLPDMEIDFPFNNQASGVLRGSEAEQFLEEVESYLDELRNRYRAQSTRFINDIAKAAGARKMSDLIFSDVRNQLDTLESGVKDKKSTIDRLVRCLAELDGISQVA